MIMCRTSNKIHDINIKPSIYLSKKFFSYQKYYSELMDTLRTWKVDSLESSKGYLFGNCWTIDSCVIFNSDTTRLYTNLMFQDCFNKDAIFDYSYGLGGAKIKINGIFFMA